MNLFSFACNANSICHVRHPCDVHIDRAFAKHMLNGCSAFVSCLIESNANCLALPAVPWHLDIEAKGLNKPRGAVHSIALPRVKPPLAGEEVPEHHQGGGHNLREHIPSIAGDEPTKPHDGLVQAKTDEGEHDEDGKLARPREALSVREHVAHGCKIVKYRGHAVRDARRDNRRQARQLGERHHNAKVDEERDNTHDAELHELRDKAPDLHWASPALPAGVPLLVEAHDVELPLAAIALHDGIQNQTRDAEKHRQPAQYGGENGSGKTRDKPRGIELRDDGNPQAESYDQGDEGKDVEERQRAVVLREGHDHAQNLGAVGEGVELGNGTLRPVAIDDWHLGNAPALVDGMDGKLGLYLESGREHREGLREDVVVGAIARHHVFELEAVKPLDEPPHQVVPKAMEGAGVLLAVGPVGEAVSHHVIRLVSDERRKQVWASLCRVGVVTVHHDVILGIDVAHHLPHHVTLALAWLRAHDSPVPAGDCGSAIGRVVVIDVDGSPGKDAMKVIDDLSHGERLVIARNEHCGI